MSDQKKSSRNIEKTIEINAPPDAVWKALTDAKELMRWFPLDARVTPGKGGSIFYSWGPPYEGENLIEIWDPPRRLKIVDRSIVNAHDEQAWERATGEATQVSIDYVLEGSKGKTFLRLVHSGFGTKESWEDEYDATNRGWTFELGSLKHYLEHHSGSDRRAVWARYLCESTRERVWQRIMDRGGLLESGSLEGLQKDDRFSVTLIGGQEFTGRVLESDPPIEFSAVIENLNDAYFQLRIDRGTACGLPPDSEPEKLEKTVQPVLWLSTYNIPNHKIISLQENWSRLLTKMC